MSSSKKDSRDIRIRNYSFSNNQSSLFSAEQDRPNREPLRQTEIIRNYSPSKFEADSGLKNLPNQNSQPSAQILYALHQEDEIRKLEEVIYYLTGDKDILKQECASLHIQLSTLTNNYNKEKENYQAEIRKLKEIVKDRDSECDSISRNAKKQKEIFQQENQRMKTQLKLLIQKKNDQIYSITREKETQNQQIKKNLEFIIEELKNNHRKQLNEKDGYYSGLKQQITLSKQKTRSLEEQIAFNDERNQSQKLRIIQNHELFLSDLKQSYHRTKIQIIQAAKDEVQALQKNSQIQRQAFLLEIDGLKKLNERQCIQNKQLHAILFEENRKFDKDINGFLQLIKQLQAKLGKIYEQKQQQLQFLKVKSAHLHSLDLQSAKQVFQLQINHLISKFKTLEKQNQRLRDTIQQGKNREKRLTAQLLQRDSSLHEQIALFKFNHSKEVQELKKQFQKEKAAIKKESHQSQKDVQNKQSKLLCQEEELKKLRKIIANKSNEVDQLEKSLTQAKDYFNSEKQSLIKEAQSHERQWTEQRQQLKRNIVSKGTQIQQLNKHLQQLAHQTIEYDYSHLQQQISKLRDTIKQRIDQVNNWKQRALSLQSKVNELQSVRQRIEIQRHKDQEGSKLAWSQKIKETIRDIQKLYQRKLEPITHQKQQLINENSQQRHRINQLQSKYQQFENRFNELIQSLNKRTALQGKIVTLGLDTNLVKSKQQLFQY